VLDEHGRVERYRTVERHGLVTTATGVLVQPGLGRSPHRPDVAVLVIAEPLPGPAAFLATAVPPDGTVTLVGYQPLDSDGSLLRGTRADDRLRPTGATGPIIRINSAPAGCSGPATAVHVESSLARVPCGLIPGASGRPLVTETARGFHLLGLISHVALDLSWTGVVPASAVRELLDRPLAYAHAMSTAPPPAAAPVDRR
jgi:hypothetical protein